MINGNPHAHPSASPSTAVQAEPLPIADMLKGATAELHLAAERHPFQAGLMRGALPLSLFAEHQGQMAHMHAGVEGAIRDWQRRGVFVPGLVREYHFREALYRDDARALRAMSAAEGSRAVDAEPAPLPASVDFVTTVRGMDEAGVLGVFYVLEGSTNGAQFIAKALTRAYRLESGAGLSALSPHGDQQRARWTLFRETLSGFSLSASERERVLQGADATFRGLIRLFDELLATQHAAAQTAR